jgi:hypothetical protein
MKCIIVHTTENLILNCYRNSASHPEKKLLLALDHTSKDPRELCNELCKPGGTPSSFPAMLGNFYSIN